MTPYKNIFEAIENNDIKAVKTFLPEQLMLTNYAGLTPLHVACSLSHIKIMRLLLDSGADIEAKDDGGRTSLHWACSKSISMVKRLVQHGAIVDVYDNYGWTPLMKACFNGYCDVAEFFVKNGADPYILCNKSVSALDLDTAMVKDNNGNEIPHKEILIQLRAEYINKQIVKASERTAALSSGWEMEM